jgi:hypothetical protein
LEHIIIVFERKANGTDTSHTETPVEVIHDVESFRRGLYETHEVDSRVFRRDERKRFLLYLSGPAKAVYDKVKMTGSPLRDFAMTVWEGIRDDHEVRELDVKTSPRTVPLLDGASIRRWFTKPTVYVDSSDIRIPDGIKSKCRVEEKIVIKRVVSSKVRIEAVIDREKSITHSSTTAVSFEDGTSLRYVVGILNSRLMNLYVRDWMFNRTELTMNFREEYLGEIPIPKSPPEKTRQRIEDIVGQLESLWAPCSIGQELLPNSKDKANQLKSELDAAVYDLYALSEADRRLVETLMPYSD